MGFKIRSPNTFQAKYSANSTILQMVHYADLLENYFLLCLNYTLKVKIANCRVYKGDVITWNSRVSRELLHVRISLADNMFSRHYLAAQTRAKMGGAFKDKHESF